MTVAFRQPINPNQNGADVLAVKRALKKEGPDDASRLKLNNKAGAAFVHCIKEVQHNHDLVTDGIYVKSTHAIIAPRFDAFGRYLYNHAKIRATIGPYVNPFKDSHKLTLSRTDQGVDYHGIGPICAIGDGVVIGNSGHGWPGGHYLLIKLTNGEHAGRYVYYAESIVPYVSAGQHVQAGQHICGFGHDGAPGRYPGIEFGWSSPTLNLTRAAATTGYNEGERTPAGKAFARFLRSLGAPTLENPGPGSHYV
jgi:murein DD-endopeptidase MepM/ murein hydrolase activator NlpD